MTKDQIEAEFEEWNENGHWIKEEVIDFAMYVINEAIAAEREECAKVCDGIGIGADNVWNRGLGIGVEMAEIANECAEAIRARSEVTK